MFPRNENWKEGTFAKTTLLRNRPWLLLRGRFGIDSPSIRRWFDIDSPIWPYFDAKSRRARRIRGWGPGGLCLINPSQPMPPSCLETRGILFREYRGRGHTHKGHRQKSTESHEFQGIFRVKSGCCQGVFRILSGLFFSLCPFRVCPLDPSKFREHHRPHEYDLIYSTNIYDGNTVHNATIPNRKEKRKTKKDLKSVSVMDIDIVMHSEKLKVGSGNPIINYEKRLLDFWSWKRQSEINSQPIKIGNGNSEINSKII